MRKLVSFLFLVVVAAGVWFGARWLVHRGEVKATIVFRDAHGLTRGDPVIENGTVVGRVVSINPIDDKTAITIRLGIEVKGLWLIDFDCGSGYYCWQWPEPGLQFFHGYEEGFRGRMQLT